jgi:hypothetical protein
MLCSLASIFSDAIWFPLIQMALAAFTLPVGTAPLHQVWWTWNNGANSAIWNSLKTELPRYLDWCKDRALRINYPSDRIEVHREMVRQYFA